MYVCVYIDAAGWFHVRNGPKYNLQTELRNSSKQKSKVRCNTVRKKSFERFRTKALLRSNMGKRWEEVCSSACHLQFEKNKNKIDEHPYSFSWHDGRKKKKISCYN